LRELLEVLEEFPCAVAALELEAVPVHSPQAGEVFERGSLGHGECLELRPWLELYDEHENKMSTIVSTIVSTQE